MTRICFETGKPLPETAQPTVRFIDADARQAWNNRRKVRGAQLYDMFMAYRYQRGVGKTLKLFSLMCKVAAEWRAEDKANGRTTFEPLVVPE